METVAKSDIFFFITSVAVLVLGALLAVLLVYGIKIFRYVRDISSLVKDEMELVREDVHDLRTHVRAGKGFMGMASRIRRLFRRKGRHT